MKQTLSINNPKAKMVRSFILESSDKQNLSKDKESNIPHTFLSLLMIDDQKPKQAKKSFDILSQCSSKSKPTSDVEIIDLIEMSDNEFLEKYNSDPFFKSKLDLKMIKFATLKSKKKGRLISNNDFEDEYGDSLSFSHEAHNTTLGDIKKKEEESKTRLYEKYLRVVGNKKKV